MLEKETDGPHIAVINSVFNHEKCGRNAISLNHALDLIWVAGKVKIRKNRTGISRILKNFRRNNF